MQRMLFYFGVSIILISLATLIAGSVMRNVIKEKVRSIPNSWELSANLTERNTYIADIFSSVQWRDDYTEGAYQEPQPVDVIIISPDGNETTLKAYFVARLPTSPNYKATFPSLVYVEYNSIDSDSLDVDEYYPQIRFITKRGGEYIIRIVNETLEWTSGPPREIVIYQEVHESPLQLITPYVGGLLLVGVVLSTFGLRVNSKKVARRKRTRRYRSRSPSNRIMDLRCLLLNRLSAKQRFQRTSRIHF